MFTGEYECTLDEKGRVSIPSRFREVLNHRYNCKLILSRWFDGCLALFPYDEWVKIANKLRETTSFTQSQGRKLQRLFFGSAIECSLDKQGRLMIPQRQRQMANINRHVVLIGMVDKIEIWSKELMDRYNEEMEQTLEDLAETINGLQL
jgi:MraZ protein